MNNKSLPVLIVDDNEDDRYLLKRQLKKTELNISFFEAADGAEALKYFEEYNSSKEKYGDDFPPILIFLDINMPFVDGFKFLEEFEKIQNAQKDYECCVVMMYSSSARNEDRNKTKSYSFVKDYLVKGEFSAEDLKEKIKSLVPQG